MATGKGEVEVAGASSFPVLAGGGEEILAIIRENVGEDGIGVLDLDSIGIPGGGGTSWEVPSLEGTDSVKALDGVIVGWRSPRFFYHLSIDETGGGQAPDCASDDGVIGVGEFQAGSEGNPSGQCATCPKNEWGSALDSKGEPTRGKACRETRQLFMLLPGSVLPISVTVPPTSIKPMKQYLLRLASNSVPYYGAVTRLELEPQQDGGRKWSVVKPSLVEVLAPELTAAAKQMGQSLQTAARRPAAPASE